MADANTAADQVDTTNSSNHRPHDLLFLVDATYSMHNFIKGLNKALPDVLRIAALTDSFERIGVMAYRDYYCKDITTWSGWCKSTDDAVDGWNIVAQKTVLKKAAHIMTQGNDDTPEASKTGLAYAYEKMRPEATTIIILYTDAPPHLKQVPDNNHRKEQEALLHPESYGGTGHHFADWTSGAQMMRDGPKKANVFCILKAGDVASWSPYQYLSEMTGGMTFILPRISADTISLMTTTMLLAWMGVDERQPKHDSDEKNSLRIPIYTSTDKISNAATEDDPKLRKFVSTQLSAVFNANSEEKFVSIKALGTVMKQRGPAVGDFAGRYSSDDKYKDLVVAQLKGIFQENVVAMSLNPVFGALWRAVCNGRGGADREILAPIFGYHIDRIENHEQRARMKTWLAQSYDFSQLIEKEIDQVAAEHKYPLVFLDPTNAFGKAKPGTKDEDLRQLRRSEFLEIGRSCDGRVLRRLGKLLTQLTIVERETDLPSHVKNADGSLKVSYVPLALAQTEYKRRFWKVLLHAALPGTMLSARPAAVLAALALKMGITGLTAVADAELLAFGPEWNDIGVPENWTAGCMQLISHAHDDIESRVAAGTAVRSSPDDRVLSEQDRIVFQTMLDYKLLEKYLEHPVEAKITWRPSKSLVAVGPLVVCKGCEFPRSVTSMGRDGFCGMCSTPPADCSCVACMRPPNPEERICANVSRQDNESKMVSWVECTTRDCRAQYVVYSPNSLYVRPKCFYCRHAGNTKMEEIIGKAPCVECSQCLGRMVWPHEYRPAGFDEQAFKCPACISGVQTVTLHETTPREMHEENGWGWLLKNVDDTIREPFNSRSIFYTATHSDLDNMTSKVELLPSTDGLSVTIKGKKVQNVTDIHDHLRQRIQNRESSLMSCSLCFSDLEPSQLGSACGRSGCKQRICADCIRSWYGINKPGCIINTAALSCPFCRRLPASKIARRHRITDIGGLVDALKESGSWIHAWCWGCNHAKQFVERVCANGAPEAVSHWQCEACQPSFKEGERTTKRCPGCEVMTDRISGCQHMSCPCGTHWCWACGKAFTSDRIYPHISAAHGGLELNEDYESEFEYDTE